MNNIFNGPFKDYLFEYYNYKTNLGYWFETDKNALITFDKYTIRNSIKKLSLNMIYDFINEGNRKQNTKASLCSRIRCFIKYLNEKNICDFNIPFKIYKKERGTLPHIYTNEELNLFFNTLKLFYKEDDFKNRLTNLCFKLLYCTGMRCGECLNIRFSDITNNSIELHNTKNNVDRVIVISDKLLNEIDELKNDYLHLKYDNENEYIFIRHNKKRYDVGDIYAIFRKVLYYAGIDHNGNGPRVHDFRHTFIVRNYQRIVENEEDYYNHIIALSTYVGHKDFSSTEYYLQLTGELFPSVREKIEKYTSHIIESLDDLDE